MEWSGNEFHMVRKGQIMWNPMSHDSWLLNSVESIDGYYIWNLKKKKKNLQSKNRLIDVENVSWLPKGKGGGRNKLGVRDWHVHTTIYKIINKDILYSIANSTQYSVVM